jgi:hypothetical protein
MRRLASMKRNPWISGEKILFTACIFYNSESEEPALSKVLYCELISPDGSRVTGGKYPLENSLSHSCLEIPGEIVSGTYYLKAYTRFMRNQGPAAYHYTKLVIINPEKPEVLPSGDNDFCTRQINLPSPLLHLSEPVKKTALALAWNYQVTKNFKYDTTAKVADRIDSTSSFYGNPTRVLLLDKYIELPTLEEYFNELPNEVKVRKSENRKYFRFYSTQTEMVIYDPLVLID